MAVAGCAPQTPTAVDPVTEEIEAQTDQQQSTVDDALNSAQATVNELITIGDGLETRIDGLQVKSGLQEIQRKLTRALEQTGDAKVAAVEEISSALNDLISRIETAASKAPAGGELQTELNGYAQQLKDVQASLTEAASGATE